MDIWEQVWRCCLSTPCAQHPHFDSLLFCPKNLVCQMKKRMFHVCSSTWDPISQTKKRSMQKKQKLDVPRMRSQRVPSKKKNWCPAHVVPPGGPNLHKRNVRHQMERHVRDIFVFFSRIDICLFLQDRTLSGTTYAGHAGYAGYAGYAGQATLGVPGRSLGKP